MDITDAAAPKSDQINADDLMSGPRVVTITEARKGSAEQPVELVTAEFGSRRPYRPGKSMIRVLINAWGAEASKYVGRRMTIYRDPEIAFGGEKVGGIRISHMSDIGKRLTIALTVTRGRRKPYIVEPLTDAPTDGMVTKAQLSALATEYEDKGLTSREQVLDFLKTAVGRAVQSSKDLTEAEAAKVLDRLAKVNEPTEDGAA